MASPGPASRGAGSLGRTRSSWLRKLAASMAKTLPRWYLTVRAVRYSRAPISQVQAVAGRPRDLGLLPGNVALATAALEWLSERTRVTSTEWALGIEALVRALLTEDEAAESLYHEAIERLGGTQRPRGARLRSPALRRVAAPRAPPC